LALLHAVAVGALLSGAATAAEAALRHRRRPARAVWIAALAATLTAPWWGPALRGPAPVLSLPTGLLSLAPEAPTAAPVPDARRWLAALEDALARDDARVAWGWGTTAALALLLVGASFARLSRRVARLPRGRVAGDEVVLAGDFGPACVGLVRPRVVLPRWALGLEGTELDLVLRHEREHARARDPLLLAGGLVAAALAPWNPGLWWQLVRLRRAVELDCDRRVLAAGAPPAAYGRMLVRMLERLRPRVFPAPALLEPTSFLERRLTLMSASRRTPWHHTVLALALAAGLAVLACETPAPTTPLAPSPSERADAADAPAGTIELAGVGAFPDDAILLVDGVRRDGADAWAIDPEHIERVEVVRGEGPPIVQVSTVRAGLRKTPAPAEATTEEPAAGRLQALPRRQAGPPPLVYVDGELRGRGDPALAGLAPESIASVDVLKGEAAERIHGPEGRHGVIRITTRAAEAGGVLRRLPAGEGGKPGGAPEGDAARGPRKEAPGSLVPLGVPLGLTRTPAGGDDPLVFVDGVRLEGGLATLPDFPAEGPGSIDRVDVIKGAAAGAIPGAESAAGVVRITTRGRNGGR
jgi:hypothetical protein